MFLKAMECGGEVAPKGMINLGLLYHSKSNTLAQGKSLFDLGANIALRRLVPILTNSLLLCALVSGDLKEAQNYAVKASDLVDAAKPFLEELVAGGTGDGDVKRYMEQFKPLRLRCHRMVGQLLAALGDLPGCEAEFRLATESFPTDPGAWQMLARILEVQGKIDEAQEITEKVKMIIATTGWQQ